HTASHPILATLSAEEARREIIAGKQRLEDILGSTVTLFAYPNGKPEVDYRHAQAELVKQAGFRAAVSTRPAAATMATDRFHLPRFTPWKSEPTGFIVRLLRNIHRSRSNTRAAGAA
ncbi:MAG: polysaccharide deacetylase family protein, partial [Gammaproteobacteria bacterium]